MQEKLSNFVKIRFPKKKDEVVELIEQWIKQLAVDYSIHSVILFGSYARDDYSFGSDIDILLVHNDERLTYEKAMMLALATSYEIDWQVHFYSLNQFKEGILSNNPLLETIIKNGIKLFPLS